MLERLNEMGFIESSAFFVTIVIGIAIILYIFVIVVLVAFESFREVSTDKETKKDKPTTETMVLNNTSRLERLERANHHINHDLNKLNSIKQTIRELDDKLEHYSKIAQITDAYQAEIHENIRELDEHNDNVGLELEQFKTDLKEYKKDLDTLFTLLSMIVKEGGIKRGMDESSNEPCKSKNKKQ